MSRVGQGADAARETGRNLEQSAWFGWLIRVGLIAYGVVHLLIGWIVLQIAWSGSGQQASQKGAFEQMAGNALGRILLWVTALGLLALVIWQALQALWGHHHDGDASTRTARRLGSAARAVVYAALTVSAVTTAAGSSSSSGNSEKTFTGKLLPPRSGR